MGRGEVDMRHVVRRFEFQDSKIFTVRGGSILCYYDSGLGVLRTCNAGMILIPSNTLDEDII